MPVRRRIQSSIDKGVAAIYALLSSVLLWITLAVLLVISAARGGMPGWAAFTALVVHPLSGVAAIIAVFLLGANSGAPHWPIGILIVLPPLIASYAAWAQQPRLHGALPATAISVTVWGILLVVSAGLIGYITIRGEQVSRQAAVDRQRSQALAAAEEAAKQQTNVDRFQRLTDASPLADWQEFIGKGNVLEQQAVDRARTLPHRQGDAEAMLRGGNNFPLFHLRDSICMQHRHYARPLICF